MLKINTQKEHQTLGHIAKIRQVMVLWCLTGLLSLSQAATITYHHFDALGSPVASTDEAGQVVWREAYQPFGTRLRKENNTNTLWYTGKPTEEFYRVSYFGARWYNPEMGRFMAMDPVGVQEGNIHSFNRYTYGNNNPYRFFDPDGRDAEEFPDEDVDDFATYAPLGEVLTETGQKVISGACVVARACDVIQGYTNAATGNFADAAAGIVPGKVGKVKKGAAFSKVAPASAKQLQKKFKHAGDFGVGGNFSKANAKNFNQAIQKHLNAPGTKEIQGSYRGNSVTFHTDPKSGLTVLQNPNGSFLSGWKLNPQQLQHVLRDGKL